MEIPLYIGAYFVEAVAAAHRLVPTLFTTEDGKPLAVSAVTVERLEEMASGIMHATEMAVTVAHLPADKPVAFFNQVCSHKWRVLSGKGDADVFLKDMVKAAVLLDEMFPSSTLHYHADISSPLFMAFVEAQTFALPCGIPFPAPLGWPTIAVVGAELNMNKIVSDRRAEFRMALAVDNMRANIGVVTGMHTDSRKRDAALAEVVAMGERIKQIASEEVPGKRARA